MGNCFKCFVRKGNKRKGNGLLHNSIAGKEEGFMSQGKSIAIPSVLKIGKGTLDHIGEYLKDADFIRRFKFQSAAKSVHHGFVGGLLEHTLSVVKLCDYFADHYPILNRDLLLTAAIFHDIGKTEELSAFPENDYTIPGFPVKLGNELKHCILAHHGELEYGSPKKPALAEALALNFADNADAKLETMTELLRSAGDNTDWLGFNRLLDSNVRKTSI